MKGIYTAPFFGEITMQPHLRNSQTTALKKTDWIAVITLIVASIANALAAAAFILSVRTEVEKGNADLVRIGVDVLRVDPEKQKQISAAREWALNLIDANTGGVKFSQEAREQLLGQPFYGTYSYSPTDYGTYSYSPVTPVRPIERRPSAEPPK